MVNLTRAKIQGVEARARVKLENGFSGFAAASYAKGDSYAPNKTPLDSVDPIKVTAGVSFRAQDGRYGGELAVTHSERKSAGRVAQVCTSGCYRPGAFTTADLTGFWRFNDALTARAGVFNLTDQAYAWWSDVRGLSSSAVGRDAYTQPGRNISLSLTYDF